MKKMLISVIMGSLLVGCGVSEETKKNYEEFQENDTIVYYNDESEDITEEVKEDTSLEDFAVQEKTIENLTIILNEMVEAGADVETIKLYLMTEWGFDETGADIWIWNLGL